MPIGSRNGHVAENLFHNGFGRFKIAGQADGESRSCDGLHIVRGRSRKLGLTRVGSATIWPDGHARMGVPRDRPDLRALVNRLKEPLEIRFRPFETLAPE